MADVPKPKNQAPKDELIFNKDRVSIFSDAVIAIAITLLVLDIRPEAGDLTSNHAVWHEVRRLLPNILAFILSFWVISRFWVTNQLFFNATSKLDMRTMQFNTFFLFIVALLPFPTTLLAASHVTQASVIIYAALLALASLTQALMWERLLVADRRTPGTTESAVLYRVEQYSASTLIFIISIGVSYLNVYAAVVFWVLFGFTRLFGERSDESMQRIEKRFVRSRRRHLRIEIDGDL